MLKIKNLRGECQHCGAPIEFHAEHTGSMAECPHCGQQTELLLAAPPEEESPLRKKAVVFVVISLLILLAGLIALGVLFKRAKSRTKPGPPAPTVAVPPVDPFAAQGFRVSTVTLDQGQGSSLVYAVGTITNVTNRQRFGVKVELELVDSSGNKIGSATDYQKVLEPNATWKFRALAANKQIAAAKVVAIHETP
jgi:hypothetical protein